MAKLNFTRPIMIFARDYNGKTYYSYSESKKNSDGEWITAYYDCRFRKEISLENKTKISIKDAWTDFYMNSEGNAVKYTFINDFDVEKEEQEESAEETEEINLSDILGDSDSETLSGELPFE